MTTNVLFTFAETASEQAQDDLRNRLLSEQRAKAVGRVSPDAKRAFQRRMWYAEVADDKAALALTRELNDLSDIESAEVPAERGIS